MGGPAGPDPTAERITQAHKTIHHHLRAAHGLLKKNPAKAAQHINAAGMAATAMHQAACPPGEPAGGDGDEMAAGPGTMNGPGGAYGG
jgi:hypothetical protein